MHQRNGRGCPAKGKPASVDAGGSAPTTACFRPTDPTALTPRGFGRRSLRVAADKPRFCNGWLLRSYKRTFSPFHRGVVTAYALEVGAAGQDDNRDPSFSAFRAVRYLIHEIPPDFFTRNSELVILVPFEPLCFSTVL